MKRATKKTSHAKLPAKLVRRRSGVHGSGVFAREFIAKGERVIEYVGERISKTEGLRREDLRLARLAAGGDGCVYVFEVTKRHDLDGDVPWNPARHINHSCAPNCESDIIRGRVWILARRDIAAGEELNYDYGFDYGEAWNHPCVCGADECATYIVTSTQRWRVRKKVASTRG